jgi:thiamine-phosphate pyrophosphorylase
VRRARRFPGQAPPDPDLTPTARLAAARLYVITADLPPDRVLELARAAVAGGADILQLRHKQLQRGQLLQLALDLRAIAGEALFIVDDHVDIALMSGADGVHLGPEDLSVASARRLGGDRLMIGASASDVETARAAIRDGADYLGSGPAFPTPIKSEKTVIGPAGIAAIGRAVDPVPVFAIGGIDESNLGELVALGVLRVCVIRAVADAADPRQATLRLREMLTA